MSLTALSDAQPIKKFRWGAKESGSDAAHSDGNVTGAMENRSWGARHVELLGFSRV